MQFRALIFLTLAAYLCRTAPVPSNDEDGDNATPTATTFNVRFVEWPIGRVYTKAMAEKDFGAGASIVTYDVTGRRRITVTTTGETAMTETSDDDGDNSPSIPNETSRALRIEVPRDVAETDDSTTTTNDDQARMIIGLKPDDAYKLSYKVKFDAHDFDFADGGILPGLGSGEAVDDLNVNLGWDNKGKLMAYVKQPGHVDDTHALKFPLDYTIPLNKWIDVEMTVKLMKTTSTETDDTPDDDTDEDHTEDTKMTGEVTIEIDDETLFNKKDLPITSPCTSIDRFNFVTYYFDDTPENNPPIFVKITDIKVHGVD